MPKWDKGHGWYRLDVEDRSYYIDEYCIYSTLIVDYGKDHEDGEILGKFSTVRAAKAKVKKLLERNK